MHEKHSASNKAFLTKKLYNLKMADSESIADHFSEFNMLVSQLESFGVNFDDEIRVLVLLSNLLET